MLRKSRQDFNPDKSKRSTQPDNVDTENVKEQNQVLKRSKRMLNDRRKMFVSNIDPHDVPLNWWEADTVKYAINYPPVRSRLEELMGSHVVRLTDRKYMLRLMSKTRENHDARQKIRIEERKLVPQSIISELLLVSYNTLVERIRQKSRKDA